MENNSCGFQIEIEEELGSRGHAGSPKRMASVEAGKVGKKRSRASRRAPTTVLTTDTSNFRAMVQEFTGIPPAPFASASPLPRCRLDLDLLGPRSLPNPFLLRPYPQRFATSFPAPPLFHSLLHPNLLTKTTPPALSEAQVLEELGLNPPLLPDLVPSDRRSPQWSEACKSAGGDLGRTPTLDLPNHAAPHTSNIRPDRIVDSWISSSDQTLDKLVQ